MRKQIPLTIEFNVLGGLVFKIEQRDFTSRSVCPRVAARALLGGAVKVIASIEDPAVIKQILAHLKIKVESKEFYPLPESRAPPQGSLFG